MTLNRIPWRDVDPVAWMFFEYAEQQLDENTQKLMKDLAKHNIFGSNERSLHVHSSYNGVKRVAPVGYDTSWIYNGTVPQAGLFAGWPEEWIAKGFMDDPTTPVEIQIVSVDHIENYQLRLEPRQASDDSTKARVSWANGEAYGSKEIECNHG